MALSKEVPEFDIDDEVLLNGGRHRFGFDVE